MIFLRIAAPLYLLFEHDLFGKPAPASPDHALAAAQGDQMTRPHANPAV
jgi:hypothetical protein